MEDSYFVLFCLLKISILLSVVLRFAAGTFSEPNGFQSAVLEIYYEYKWIFKLKLNINSLTREYHIHLVTLLIIM